MLQQTTRWLFRHEKLPPTVLWLLVADGMRLWYRALRRGLAPHLGGADRAQATLSKICASVFTRRLGVLRQQNDRLTEDQTGAIMGALYMSPVMRESDWILSEVGGAPNGLTEGLRAQQLLLSMSPKARWEEVSTHLGEVLIALTKQLPAEGLPNANSILGKLCFESGVRYGNQMKKLYQLPQSPDSAIEVLRMSEYLFRVNPEHWGASDPTTNTGYIEGTACPWYTAPGWSMMHCGIFGQFQSGISSVFGLRYQLTRTIPKHGGHTCRIDLKPR
jgi:hypothetical protein